MKQCIFNGENRQFYLMHSKNPMKSSIQLSDNQTSQITEGRFYIRYSIPMHTHTHTHSRLTQSRFRILPSSSHTLTYNLYPIATGTVPLPHLDLVYQRDPKASEAIVQGSLPATIFIKVGTTSGHCDTSSAQSALYLRTIIEGAVPSAM